MDHVRPDKVVIVKSLLWKKDMRLRDERRNMHYDVQCNDPFGSARWLSMRIQRMYSDGCDMVQILWASASFNQQTLRVYSRRAIWLALAYSWALVIWFYEYLDYPHYLPGVYLKLHPQETH